jgi:hypothetical protein
MEVTTQIESYKFWDIVELWGRELLEHEVIISRKLATGIIKEGLRFQSTNPKWLKSNEELLSYPYVGYSAFPGEKPIIIKAETLEHLLSVSSEKIDASKQILESEVVTKNDFKSWLVRTGQSFPRFWFNEEKKQA